MNIFNFSRISTFTKSVTQVFRALSSQPPVGEWMLCGRQLRCFEQLIKRALSEIAIKIIHLRLKKLLSSVIVTVIFLSAETVPTFRTVILSSESSMSLPYGRQCTCDAIHYVVSSWMNLKQFSHFNSFFLIVCYFTLHELFGKCVFSSRSQGYCIWESILGRDIWEWRYEKCFNGGMNW